LILKIIPVFCIAILEIWGAIPLGLALKLNPILIILLSITGGISGLFVVVFFGDKIRNKIIKIHGHENKEKKKETLIQKIWNKYGVIGLGIFSPLLTGAPFGAAIGITFGAKPSHLFFWTCTGIIIWSTILTLAGYFGFSGITNLMNE
jgi:membrane protein DedA with SNARE-associated domain